MDGQMDMDMMNENSDRWMDMMNSYVDDEQMNKYIDGQMYVYMCR